MRRGAFRRPFQFAGGKCGEIRSADKIDKIAARSADVLAL